MLIWAGSLDIFSYSDALVEDTSLICIFIHHILRHESLLGRVSGSGPVHLGGPGQTDRRRGRARGRVALQPGAMVSFRFS